MGLRFIPIMFFDQHKPLENRLKYFLVQSVGSSIFLFFSLVSQYVCLREYIIVLTLIVKLGRAPFHSWFLSILKDVRLIIYFLLTTLQKIIPFFIISLLKINYLLIVFLVLFNFIVLAFNGWGSIRLSKILAFSRFNGLGWIFISATIKLSVFITFILIYIFILIRVFFMFNSSGEKTFLHLLGISLPEKFFIVFILLSLGGLPPFIGFLGKIFVLKQVVTHVGAFPLLLLIFSSLIVLFFYLGLTYFRVSASPKISKRVRAHSYGFIKTIYFLRITIVWRAILINI